MRLVTMQIANIFMICQKLFRVEIINKVAIVLKLTFVIISTLIQSNNQLKNKVRSFARHSETLIIAMKAIIARINTPS